MVSEYDKSYTKLKNLLLPLAEKNPNADPALLSNILDSYEKLTESEKKMESARRRAENALPSLFTAGSVGKDYQFPYLWEIEERESHAYTVDELLEKRERCIRAREDTFSDMQDELHSLFPASEFDHASRIKNKDRFRERAQEDFTWSRIDLFGLRVVPQDAHRIYTAAQKFENAHHQKISYVLNTFALSKKEIHERISKHSIYYLSIHYYLQLGDFFMEVQFRPPATNQWSELQHDTVYKKRIPVSREEQALIMDFGRICNLVDYSDMIGGDNTKEDRSSAE